MAYMHILRAKLASTMIREQPNAFERPLLRASPKGPLSKNG